MTADELHVALDAMYELRKSVKNGATPWKDYVGSPLSDEFTYRALMREANVSLTRELEGAKK